MSWFINVKFKYQLDAQSLLGKNLINYHKESRAGLVPFPVVGSHVGELGRRKGYQQELARKIHQKREQGARIQTLCSWYCEQVWSLSSGLIQRFPKQGMFMC